MNGPAVRTDIVDAYVYRRAPAGVGPPSVELLQLRRTRAPLAGSWQPVMGHVEAGETAVACLWRELREEIGLERTDEAVVRAHALEQVHPFFLAELDCVVFSPRFAVEVAAGWEPTLNDEHDAARWVAAADAGELFLWPGQRSAIAELLGLDASPRRAALTELGRGG